MTCEKHVTVYTISILGPLRFLILYTDDTLLYYSAETATTLQANINTDLQSLSKWLNENLLTLNYDKTKFLIFANKKQLKTYSNINITINNQKIKQGQSFKYLGVTLSQ